MMARRYDMVAREDCYGSTLAFSDNGRFVRYEDYTKLSDLCERMATLLKYVPYIATPSGKSIRAAVAEWEAMK